MMGGGGGGRGGLCVLPLEGVVVEAVRLLAAVEAVAVLLVGMVVAVDVPRGK
jgi:hypothetical protein